jgi:hypothetical protein
VKKPGFKDGYECCWKLGKPELRMVEEYRTSISGVPLAKCCELVTQAKLIGLAEIAEI